MTATSGDILDGIEWYDNHKLSVIRNCQRKAFWHLLYNGDGLDGGVGDAAHFGTCIHAALAVYYHLWGKATESERRVAAVREFDRVYDILLGSGQPPDTRDKKHYRTRGFIILDAYCDHFALEDHLFEPVELELAFVVTISPREGDPTGFTTPFVFTGACDGVFRRVNYDDLAIMETKTASSPDREMTRLLLAQQIRGYHYGLGEFPGRNIMGALPNIIAINAQKLEFKRDFIRLSSKDAFEWRYQTIRTVERWRQFLAYIKDQPLPVQLLEAEMNSNECTRYGLCEFFRGCQFGPSALELGKFKSTKEWSPLKPRR